MDSCGVHAGPLLITFPSAILASTAGLAKHHKHHICGSISTVALHHSTHWNLPPSLNTTRPKTSTLFCSCFNTYESICVEILLFTTASRPALGPTQPPIQWVPGFLSLGIKRPGSEADHSSPSSALIKNAWSYTSTPPIRLHGVVLG
jgi:hypothetical protein